MSLTTYKSFYQGLKISQQAPLLFALVLLLLIPILHAILPLPFGLILTLTYSFLILCGILSFKSNRRHLTITLILGLISFFFVWQTYFNLQANELAWAKTISLLLFFSYLSYRLFEKILQHETVNLNIIFASISGYLMIGIIGGFGFQSLELAMPDSFNWSASTHKTFDLQYFSFVTLSSLGFGDITPKSEAAKSLTIILTVVGQLYLTILIAILVGKFLIHKIPK